MVEGRYCRTPSCTVQLSSLAETHCAFHKHHTPVFVSPTLYDDLARAGHDMRWYAKTEPMPE